MATPERKMLKLKVEGMSCGHCVGTVKKALEGVPKVAQASVDLASGEASVEGTPDSQALLDALARAGYEARLVA